MENRFFSRAMLNVLLHPERWMVVSSFISMVEPLTITSHLNWGSSHQHEHPDAEVLLVLSGQGVYGCLGQWYPCQPGSLFAFRPGESHDNGCTSSTSEMVLLAINTLPGYTSFGILAAKHGAFTAGPWQQFLTDLEAPIPELLAARAPSLPLPPEILKYRLVSTIAHATSILVEYGYRRPVSEDTINDQRHVIRVVQRYIDDHRGRCADLKTLARLSGYSPYYLTRLFHQHTGQTIHAYIDDCRMRYVSELLEQNTPKQAIARELGFAHSSTFSRWLRKQYTMSMEKSYGTVPSR